MKEELQFAAIRNPRVSLRGRTVDNQTNWSSFIKVDDLV